MGKRKSYYMQLKPHVLKFVTHYKDDFFVHDKSYFRKHPTGAFLFAMRNTGTNICNLEGWDDTDNYEGKVDSHLWGNKASQRTTKETEKQSAKEWMTTYNKRFFHGRDGVVEEITKERAIEIIDAL